jgi:hypothetical protein
MKPTLILAAALVLLGRAQPSHAETQTWFGFQVGIRGGSPAPPPYSFHDEPRVVIVNDVHVVNDPRCRDDVFRARNAWWRLYQGAWYRSAAWHGPWVMVDVRRVPESILVVPARHWKHHPRHRHRDVLVVRDHDRGRGHRYKRDSGHSHHDHD